MSEEVKNTQDVEQEEAQVHELTNDELKRRIESESDKKLSKALKTAKAKWEAEFEERLQERVEEQQRISKLSEKERQEEALTKREQELAEREAELKRLEVRSEAIDELNTRGIDTRFVNFLVSADSEQTFERIKEFNTLLDDVINEEVKSLTRQAPIKVGGTNINARDKSDNNILNIARSSRIIK